MAGLRGAWRAAALSVTDTPELVDLLERRLAHLESSGRLDQDSLVTVLDEASGRLHLAGKEAEATELTRRLLRSVYEFLLAVDARREAVNLGMDPVGALPVGSDGQPHGDGVLEQIRHLLHRGELEEAAEVLRRLGDSSVGPALVRVAVDAGDACRAAGLQRAAGDCYLAAWYADRLDDCALWRLADLAVAAADFDLAVSYLDRVAAVLRWRGDGRGVARVYRKMSILAPDRDDLRELVRRSRDEAAVR